MKRTAHPDRESSRTPIGARGGMRRGLAALVHDCGGQAMTEYVILTAVMVVLAAYLYHPDNGIYQAFRVRYDRTVEVIAKPGP